VTPSWLRRAVVTHDVEEALRLADRVLMMESGIIANEVVVDLPRPRDVGDPRFGLYRRRLLGWLGVEADTAPSK
jgi:sulfonate transport system ATP-binding protein